MAMTILVERLAWDYTLSASIRVPCPVVRPAPFAGRGWLRIVHVVLHGRQSLEVGKDSLEVVVSHAAEI